MAVQDVDWLTWSCLPEHPDRNLLRETAAAVWSGDVHLGRRLPALLRDAGLVDVEVVPHLRVFRPGEPYHRLLGGSSRCTGPASSTAARRPRLGPRSLSDVTARLDRRHR